MTAAVVTLHLWGVPRRGVPAAMGRMATDRLLLRRTPGLTFAKLLGTGSGTTFTLRDADLGHWAVLAAWTSAAAAEQFESGPLVRGWDRSAQERLRVLLRPVASRGTWSRRAPFERAPLPGGTARWPPGAPVAAITRARIRASRALTFWRAVPPVSADLRGRDGLRLAVGIGEAPLGLQGTFSVWRSSRALADFAYRGGPHTEAIRRTAETGWYSEQLFARFAVLDLAGTYRGRTP